MSCRKTFLFVTLLILVLLTQVLVLGWRPETLFFVTWLFLALTVRHDSRLSAVVGLAFLALCPFLLIAKKEAAAEQAANYAYFFLAIGVLVQLEELLLERFGWLDRKVDLSPLWAPVVLAFRRSWSAAERARGRLPGTAGPTKWLLRVVLVLAVVLLASAGIAWLSGLVTTDRLARLEVANDFVAHLAEAEVASPGPDYVHNDYWTIDGEERRVLFMHPDSHVQYMVQVPKGAVLAFDVATAPESWDKPGDGVTFAVYIESEQGTEQVFSTYIDPKWDESARRWHPFMVDLGDYAGQTVNVAFETTSGPAGDDRYDWAGWGTPRLLIP